MANIQRLLLSAKKRGGTPTLESVLGKLFDNVTEVTPCPHRLLASHPIWIPPHRLPSGKTQTRPPNTILFFTTPYEAPPRVPPSKKRVDPSDVPVILCSISLSRISGKLEQRLLGNTFTMAVPRAKWLEFPPGHALIEIKSTSSHTTNDNRIERTRRTFLLGFPRGRPAGLATVVFEKTSSVYSEELNAGKIHLVQVGSRYFLVEESLTYQGSTVRSDRGPQTTGEWKLTYSITELDPETQAPRELKGLALKRALKLPQLKGFVGAKGRGAPPEL